MGIDRCYCHQVPFVLLKELSAIWGPDLERLCHITKCGTGCGMCRPYIRVMLRTGVTDLPVMPTEQFDRMMREELDLGMGRTQSEP
jgi:NAD(P)H-nitrite reductase large subunit